MVCEHLINQFSGRKLVVLGQYTNLSIFWRGVVDMTTLNVKNRRCVCVSERDRDTDRETERDRQTERQTDRQKHRQSWRGVLALPQLRAKTVLWRACRLTVISCILAPSSPLSFWCLWSILFIFLVSRYFFSSLLILCFSLVSLLLSAE